MQHLPEPCFGWEGGCMAEGGMGLYKRCLPAGPTDTCLSRFIVSHPTLTKNHAIDMNPHNSTMRAPATAKHQPAGLTNSRRPPSGGQGRSMAASASNTHLTRPHVLALDATCEISEISSSWVPQLPPPSTLPAVTSSNGCFQKQGAHPKRTFQKGPLMFGIPPKSLVQHGAPK